MCDCCDSRRGRSGHNGRPMADGRDDWPGKSRGDEEMEGYGSPEFGFKRHFISRAEMLESLNSYLEELENEAEGVREAIDELLDEMMECGDIEEDSEEDDDCCCEKESE